MSAAPYILLVCDCPSQAGEITRALQQSAESREVRVVAENEEALRLIAEDKPELVFCHLRRGTRGSTLFLNEVWKKNSKGARFLLDSSTDSAGLVDCVLGGHEFLELPLKAKIVRQAIERSEAIKQYVRSDRIQALVSRMRTLPSKPSNYLEVMREVRSPGASATTVGEIIQRDLGVSTKLIQMVNSPFYAVSHPITDLKEAVLFLGLETTAAVVTSVEALSRFDKPKPLYFSADRIWKHSQLIAEIAKKICQLVRADYALCEEVYLAALLHDIGQLAFAENFNDRYHRLLKDAEEQDKPLSEVEEDAFGVNHADTAAYLLAMWGLPVPIVDAVAKHHRSPRALGDELTASMIVNLAEEIVEGFEPLEKVIERYPSQLGLGDKLHLLEALVPAESRRLKQKTTPGANGQGVAGAVATERNTPRPAARSTGETSFRRSNAHREPSALSRFFAWLARVFA